MIALLTGKIAYKSPDFIIMDVNGVGYRVMIPFSTYFALPSEGESLSLHIHTQVKEDSIHLYGFRTTAEKLFFQLLLSVSGVGPKLARDILSNSHPAELAAALTQGNLTRLSAIPGIGKKTAERLVLELRDKIRKLGIEPDLPIQTLTGQTETTIRDDVASALVNLGYKDVMVTKVITGLELPADATMETALKLALKKLMR